MAAGTAAALVPIRSITRHASRGSAYSLPASAEAHARVAFKDDEQTITYIQENQGEPGALCVKLLAQLKGIQLGKIQDEFGWRFEVSEADGAAVVGDKGVGNGGGPTVDQLD